MKSNPLLSTEINNFKKWEIYENKYSKINIKEILE